MAKELAPKKIYPLMVLTSFFWGGAFIAGKVSVQEIPPLSLTFFRFGIASLIIFAIMARHEQKDWHLKKEDWPIVIFLGIVGMVGYHLLFFGSLQYTSAINSSMIAAANPLVTAVLSVFFLKEKLTPKRLGAILLAFSGVILTITDGDISVLRSLQFNLGDIMMLAAITCWAVYSIVSRHVMPRYSPLILTTYSFIVCSAAILPFMLAIDKPWVYIPHTTYKGWAGVFYMALFPSVFGYLMQQHSLKTIGATKTAIFSNLATVFSIFLAAIILHEQITLLKVFSAAIIIIGVYLTSRL